MPTPHDATSTATATARATASANETAHATDWEPLPDVDAPLAELRLADLALLAEITHPIRGPILRRLKEPRTVAELAELLGVPVTRLYHHVNRLAELDLIRVVAIRRVAAVTERRYQVAATSYRLADELFDGMNDRDLALALGSLFDVAKLDLQREVERGAFRDADDRDDRSILSLGDVSVSADRHRALIDRLRAVIAEFGSDVDPDDPTGARVTLFIAAFPSTR